MLKSMKETSNANAILLKRSFGQEIFRTGEFNVFYTSGTFVVPDGVKEIKVRCVGAGGSGAAAYNNSVAGTTGGGGGGYSQKIIKVQPFSSYSVTVGIGGVGVSHNSGSIPVNGVAGGTTSFGTELSATGGSGGLCGPAGTINGATGGIGIGGDINYTGGGSGSITSTRISSRATGGGSAATWLGNGYSSGIITTTNNTNLCTGGASVRCSSGSILLPINDNIVTGGAGCGGPSVSANGGPDLYGYSVNSATNVASLPTWAIQRFSGDVLTGGGSGGNSFSVTTSLLTAGPGAGGGAIITSTSSITVRAGDGGVFGGGGAAVTSGPGSVVFGGSGGNGGGGGGGYTYNGTAYSGAGGNGLVIVEW